MSTGAFATAVVGVGNMGAAIAANLLEQGWPVQVGDVDAAKVGKLCAMGARALVPETLLEAQALIVCVVDAEQTEQVLFGAQGLAARMQTGSTVLLCPTLAPNVVENFARRLALSGLNSIDAPMSGGPARARDGSMSLMLACGDAVFLKCKPLLSTLSSRIFQISEKPGDGARTKLVNNLLAGINLVGAAEVLVMAQRMGLNMSKTLEVIEQSSGQSWIGSDRMRRALAGDFAPRAHVTLLEKDTRLAVLAAAEVGFLGPLGTAAQEVFARASAAGLNGLDDAAILQWIAAARSIPGAVPTKMPP